ncbi:tetratricopeptide repeat protein [Candidatus Atribacteria bacterium 1244-E10-H5-B2]|nr:MAG: tetratricopeptide repeat protein [Candidatus Atribacteria bacterium 1244-E10-H5-B2]
MSRKKISLSNYCSSFHTKAIEATIIGLIIIVPIAFHPWCFNFYTPAKEFVYEILIITGLMFWALKMVGKEEIKFTPTPLNLPVISFIAICTLSLIWSDTFFTSLKELPLFLSGPLLYFLIVNNIKSEKQINRIIGAVTIVAAVLGIYGIFQYNGIDFYFIINSIAGQRVYGLFGNAGYFAGYIILPLSLAISLFLVSKNRKRKILLLIGILAMGTTFIVTFTRSSYLALGISLIFMFLLFLLARGKRFIVDNKKIFIFLLIIIILTVSLFIIPTSLSKPGTTISRIKGRVSIAQLKNTLTSGARIAIWKVTGTMIKDRPILGSGIGTFKYNDLRYQAKFFEQGDNRTIYPHVFADKAHNEYLQLWAELGIIGLAIFLWLMIAYFNYGVRYLKKEKDEQRQGIMIGLMGAVVAFLVHSFFWFPLHLTTNVSLLWLFIGLATVMGIEKNGKLEVREKIKITQIDYDKEKRRKKKKKRSDLKENNIHRFKPILYVVIVLLAIFLCITVARPFMARIHWYSGFKEVEKENWEKANEIYEVALKWDPYEGGLYYDLGKIFMIQDLYNTALKYFEKAEKYFDLPGLPQNFAIIYLAKGDLDEAINSLKQAISYQHREETMPPFYNELGNVYLKLEKYEPAEAAFKNALKIDPNLVNAHYRLSGIYLRQNKIEETLVELEKVVELAPDSQEAKYARDAIQKIEQEKPESQPTNQ